MNGKELFEKIYNNEIGENDCIEVIHPEEENHYIFRKDYGNKELNIEVHNEDEFLDFNNLRKIISKSTNNKLDDFIEYIDCSCDSFSLIDICRAIDNYEESHYHDLITSLSKDLKDYDVAMDDEDDLTDCGYDFLILFTQKEILEEHHREWVKAVA